MKLDNQSYILIYFNQNLSTYCRRLIVNDKESKIPHRNILNFQVSASPVHRKLELVYYKIMYYFYIIIQKI